ncbi:DUF3703 domain-containing protein [Pseudomonas sp. CrR25]|nr:DUF3703 domain-containing protein [Pseudomonas sp. CrR25]
MMRRRAFLHELHLARQQRSAGDPLGELHHLERAHVLAQPNFADHLRSHLWLLAWAWRRRDWAELVAQLLRLPGSLGSLVGVYPLGNPGTRRIGALTPQPVPEDLRKLLR